MPPIVSPLVQKILLRHRDLVLSCDTVRNGSLRIETPFLYRDGDHIDVFLTERDSYYTLSDFGQTVLQLHNEGVQLDHNTAALQFIQSACTHLGVTFYLGELELRIAPWSEFMVVDSIRRLCQVCIQASTLGCIKHLQNETELLQKDI